MKRLLWCAIFLILLVPVTASAGWGGLVGVYADAPGSYCSVVDTPGMRTVYVLQKFTAGTASVRFRIEFSNGFAGTLVSVTSPYAGVSGDPLVGTTVTYDTCVFGTIEVLELHLLLTGSSPECSWVRVAPHLSPDGFIDTYDCNLDRAAADWGGLHIQHDIYTWCPNDSEGYNEPVWCRPYTPPLPVESSTWGAVKALYR